MKHRAAARRPCVLVIGGTDSSGGAGLTRDARTLALLGIETNCAVTAVTAQSDRRVASVHHVAPSVIREQIETAFEAHRPDAIKIGMLGNRASVEAVDEALQARGGAEPLVLDPVLMSSSGGVLLDAEGRRALAERLLPRSTLVTPNLPEAAHLLGEALAEDEEALLAQARRILGLGTGAVLVKGGHAEGDEAADWLVVRDRPPERLVAPRVRARLRGTGCALASAIAGELARGAGLPDACRRAKALVLAELRAVAHDD